jgi:hypothetical protein
MAAGILANGIWQLIRAQKSAADCNRLQSQGLQQAYRRNPTPAAGAGTGAWWLSSFAGLFLSPRARDQTVDLRPQFTAGPNFSDGKPFDKFGIAQPSRVCPLFLERVLDRFRRGTCVLGSS